MDLTISGVVSIACPGEGYKYDGASAITLPGMNTAGDCVHDAIAKEGGVSIKSITYDASSDSIRMSRFQFVDLAGEHMGREIQLFRANRINPGRM